MELFHPYKVKVIFTPNIACLWRLFFFQKQAALAELVLASLKEPRRQQPSFEIDDSDRKNTSDLDPPRLVAFFGGEKLRLCQGKSI